MEPIDNIKEDIAQLQSSCDELIQAINSSNQAEAANKLKTLKNKLNKISLSLDEEFSWLIPQKPEQ
ncbi:MAG: hypothetical protein ISS01_01985 [Nanoarchaeota archaeon]|nr:hypothetical protein [Nanoarchaeota archaeon]